MMLWSYSATNFFNSDVSQKQTVWGSHQPSVWGSQQDIPRNVSRQQQPPQQQQQKQQQQQQQQHHLQQQFILDNLADRETGHLLCFILL